MNSENFTEKTLVDVPNSNSIGGWDMPKCHGDNFHGWLSNQHS